MRYFIADTHFGHSNMIRGMLRFWPGTNELFQTIEDHDRHLLGAINCTVKPNDELFILGDFAALPGKYRAQILCRKVYLIRGNHDPYQKCMNVFGDIPTMRTVKLRNGEGASLKCVLCHYPIAYWEGSHKGWAHLHGHTHGQREVTLDDAFGYYRRMMDVGVDALFAQNGSYFPMGEDELYSRFTSFEGHDLPEFYEKLQANRDRRYGFDPMTRPNIRQLENNDER